MKKRSLSQRSRNSGKEFPWQNSSLLTPVSSRRKFFFFSQDHFFLHRSRHSGRECAWWTNSLVGQYLHQLSLVQSSRSIQRMQTVPWPKRFFRYFREDHSLPHRPRNSGRECVGQFLHQLSLVQSLRSIQRMQTVSWPKLSFSIF